MRAVGRARYVLGVLILGTLATSSGTLTGCSPGHPESPKPAAVNSSAPSSGRVPAAPATRAPAPTLVAHALGPAITWYTSPELNAPGGSLANPNPRGVPLVFAVGERRGRWLHVRLPIRPNGTTGWLQASDVTLSKTPYALRVSRVAHTLTVQRAGRVIVRLPVGIGTGRTPTPVGAFYLTELLRPANPAGPWGPYAFGLSGFSDVITQFNGAEGIIGLHGTNRPDLIGTDASLGCIRLRNADIERLADLLPLGTPISITD